MNTFAIISLPRSGSTFLSLTLRRLPDVNTDFEVKFPVADRPYVKQKSGVHLFLNNELYSDLIKRNISGKGIRGSKIVLDLDPYSPTDIEALLSQIEPQIPIVLLTRRLPEIVLSMGRGAVNLLNEKGTSHLEASLARNSEKIKPQEFYKRQVIYSKTNFLKDRISALQTMTYLKNALACRGNYIQVDYTQIVSRLHEVARFIGSRATEQDIRATLVKPATIKLGMHDQRSYAKQFTNVGNIAFAFDGVPFEYFFLKSLLRLYQIF